MQASNDNERGRASGRSIRWLALLGAALVLAGIVAAWLAGRSSATKPASPAVPNPAPAAAPVAQPNPATTATTGAPELTTMEVAKAVMVTVELDFGGKPPSIADALAQVERRYQPDDGVGRTFAVLDAYGQPTPEDKLHMSMHISSEKPGGGQLIFRRTGEVLWRAKINPTSQLPGTKSLTILIDNLAGKNWTVDGSTNPTSVLNANAKEVGRPVQELWSDGTEREVTFIYSACGCPVKVMVKRVGDRTVRTKDTPVIFPDDPAAVAVIKRLMRW